MELILGAIIFVSYTIQAMTGFGSIVLAITFGSFFYPIREILPVLVMLDLILNLYIILKHFSHVELELLFRKIIPLMFAGAVFGLSIFKTYAGGSKSLLGLVVSFLAIFELFNFYRGKEERLRPGILNLFVFGSGVVEGMYASGGPLLVYVLNKLDLDKSSFRSTLALLWIVMDIFLVVAYVTMGISGYGKILKSLVFLPVVAVSLLTGELLHTKVNEKNFRLVVLYVLLIGGFSIITGR